MSKITKEINRLGFSTKRPMCSKTGCNNKARRIGKRIYGGTCLLHMPQYYAANTIQPTPTISKTGDK